MIKSADLEKTLKELHNKSKDKFPNVDFYEREQRLVGYRQAIKDISALFEINLWR